MKKMFEADPVLRGRPIVLQSKDGHAQWVSEAVLQSMLPLPDSIVGGIIGKDEEGNPTGMDTIYLSYITQSTSAS